MDSPASAPVVPAGTVRGAAGSLLRAGPRFARRVAMAAAAITDQACVAGAGFLANVLLARWLPLDAYGAYALGMSAFLFIGALHQGALGEPQQVFSATRFATDRGAYFAGLARIHWWLSGLAAAAVLSLALAADWLGWSRWTAPLVGTAVMLPGTLFFWLSRSAAYAAGIGRCAALGGATYLIGTIGALIALHLSGTLSPATALASAGASGLLAGLVLRVLIRRRVPAAPATPWRELLAAHRGYAGWAMLSAVVSWVCANLHLVILTVSGGLAAAAGMKALDTTLTPVIQGFTALSQVALPALAGSLAASAIGDARAIARLALTWTAFGTLAALALWVFGDHLLSLLYGERFGGHGDDLRVYALMLPPYAASAALTLACRALARADLCFAFAVLSAVLLAIGYALGGRFGVHGMVWACVAAQLIALPALVWSVARAVDRPKPSAAVG